MCFRLWFYNGFSFRGSRSSDDRSGGGAGIAILIAIVFVVVAYLLSFIIRLALSRSREFLADAGSVELTKNPDAMISALRKIEGHGELPRATSAVMEMCIDNPREGFGELFDTHPSVDSRVAALVKFAGGHDPGPLALPAQQPQPVTRTAGVPGPWDTAPPGGPWGASTESGTERQPSGRHRRFLRALGTARNDPSRNAVTINHVEGQTNRFTGLERARSILRLPNRKRGV